ncbi:MAG TPA: alpha/beta hydrolase [Kofleriaceae bacterium]|nr:alpha/beta hydrolase [Kofleriaceae bacterium]
MSEAALHHALVEPPGGAAEGWVLFLHGIMGTGANWRTIARKLVAARGDVGAVLVDLRMHGRSQALAPPHTIEAAAGDLDRLAAELAAGGRPVRAVVGHSFGGKVALAWRASAPAGLCDTWVMDASPGTRAGGMEEQSPTSPVRVLGALDGLPARFAERGDFTAALEARGVARAVAEWLAMNLERADGGLALRLDTAALRALMADFYARDLWDAALSDALPGAVHVVIAERSSALPQEDRARLEAAGPPARVHRVDAGHWLHLEAPDAVLALLVAELVVTATR